MSAMVAGMFEVVQGKRVLLSRILIVFILAIVLLTHHSWPERAVVHSVMESIGFFLITLGAFGRMWAALYIAGRKGKQLVTTGPYSICRNPLYFFNVLMGLGMIAAFENLLLIFPFALFYLGSYFFTILAEERDLTERFGAEYEDYRKRVPRFFPVLWKYRRGSDAEGWLVISEPRVLKSLFESGLFVLLIAVTEIVEDLYTYGILPIVFKF